MVWRRPSGFRENENPQDTTKTGGTSKAESASSRGMREVAMRKHYHLQMRQQKTMHPEYPSKSNDVLAHMYQGQTYDTYDGSLLRTVEQEYARQREKPGMDHAQAWQATEASMLQDFATKQRYYQLRGWSLPQDGQQQVAPQQYGGESFSIKPDDSISARHKQFASESGAPEQGRVVGYFTMARSPMDSGTQKQVEEHLYESRAHALSRFAVGYDVDNVKPVQDTIDKINAPQKVRHILLSGSPESSTEGQGRPQDGSVFELPDEKRAEIERWRRQQ